MIRIDVEPYCPDFEPVSEIQRDTTFYGTDPDGKRVRLVMKGDTLVRCKHRNRCRALSSYLDAQKSKP